MTHTDIKSDGWISRLLPEIIQPYAILARLDRPIGIWLLLLPGWWAIMLASGGITALNIHDIRLLALFGIGAIIMRAAGCVINDIWDRKLDQTVARTAARPLAAGTIKTRHAFIFLASLLILGALILFLTQSLVTILLGFLVLPLIAVYPLMKRITWWPQLFLGITFNFGALMGWAAVTGILSIPALLLWLAGIFWTLGYDTIYAHQDKEDDMRIGIKSTAIKLGKHNRHAISGFYGITIILITAAFITAQAGWLSFVALPLAALHLMRQIRNWDETNPESALTTFKSNRNLGLLILLAAML